MINYRVSDKGYIQLAIRSGQYKKINVLSIKEGELINFDPLNEEIDVSLIEDEETRENAKTMGYYVMFEYMNGFRKAMYWSKAKMEAHAKKYSKGYAAKRGYTFWEKDFDSMACKTMLRQIISKWGIMSIELQKAYERDETVSDANASDKFDYVESYEDEEEVKEPVTKKRKAKAEDPLKGTPFEDDAEVVDVPDFVTQVESE